MWSKALGRRERENVGGLQAKGEKRHLDSNSPTRVIRSAATSVCQRRTRRDKGVWLARAHSKRASRGDCVLSATVVIYAGKIKENW